MKEKIAVCYGKEEAEKFKTSRELVPEVQNAPWHCITEKIKQKKVLSK